MTKHLETGSALSPAEENAIRWLLQHEDPFVRSMGEMFEKNKDRVVNILETVEWVRSGGLDEVTENTRGNIGATLEPERGKVIPFPEQPKRERDPYEPEYSHNLYGFSNGAWIPQGDIFRKKRPPY